MKDTQGAGKNLTSPTHSRFASHYTHTFANIVMNSMMALIFFNKRKEKKIVRETDEEDRTNLRKYKTNQK